MKKLLALLMALMMLMGCGAAVAQTAAEEDFRGYWKLESLSANGQTLMADYIGWNGFVSFREDGTAIFALDDDSFTGTVYTFKDGACVLENNDAGLPMTIGEDGKLHCVADVNGSQLEIVFVRGELPAVDPQLAALSGEWTLVQASMNGASMSESLLKSYSLTVYPDGYGRLQLGSMGAAFRMWVEDGTIYGIDTDDMTFRATVDAQGQLRVEMVDSDLVFTCQRAEAEPAPAAQPDGQNPFLGEWRGVNAILMGMEFPLDSLGVGEIELRIEPDMAYIVLGGDDGSCAPSFEGDTCVFSNGTSKLVGTIEDGYLLLTMDVDGATVSIRMERVGDAAVAEPETQTAETPAASAFEGTWIPESYQIMGMTLYAADLDMELSLDISGDVALLNVDGSVAACRMTVNGSTCILSDESEDTIDCTLIEDGVLEMELESDGIVLTVRMVRQGDAPAAETPAETETPVETEAPVESVTPAEGYDGVWNIAGVERGGEVASPESLGVTGTLKITGESGRYTFNTDSLLGIVTIEDNGLTLSTREGEIVFTLNGQGYLCRSTLMDGDTVVLLFAREGAAAPVAEPAVAEAPVANEGFDGYWRGTAVQVLGMDYELSELGMDTLDVEINGTSGRVIYEDSQGRLDITADGDRLLLYDGYRTMPFYKDAEGRVVLEVEFEGLTMKVFMQPGGAETAAPAAEAPATGAQMAVCDFCGAEHDAATSKTVGTLLLCPECYNRFME